MYVWNPLNSGLIITLKKALMSLISRIRLRRRHKISKFETEPLKFSVEKVKIRLQWMSKVAWINSPEGGTEEGQELYELLFIF